MLKKHGKITTSVRGQKLFVRPIEPDDSEALERFVAAYANGRATPKNGLLGKLVGNLVAVMAIDVSAPGKIRIESLVVATEYRRKRVGRVMIRELESLARKMERDWLVVEPVTEGSEFLRKVGFIEQGRAMMKRVEF